MNPEDRLIEIATLLREGRDTPPVSVREFLSWFGVQRRGYSIVTWIREMLNQSGLKTEPDFEAAYIESEIDFRLSSSSQTRPDQETAELETVPLTGNLVLADPTYRISKLAAANNPPTRIAPEATLQEAVTVMLSNDFSQLPVMTSERSVKGIVSWNSIGSRLALGKNGGNVHNFLDGHQEIRADSSLFSAIPTIVEHDYVLVRGADNRITGIVTASDLSGQFLQLAEPFLLLGEIENLIRRILLNKFAKQDFEAVRDPEDGHRQVTTVSDLTFGEYIRLLENGDRWQKLGIPIDRVTFIRELDLVRMIRNDIMHFDPDPIPDTDLERLRNFAGFLKRLHQIGIPS